MTIKSFSVQSSVSDTLIRRVVRQFGTWEDFQLAANDIASHGADGGWAGFTYYVDTIRFARKNRHWISNLAWEQAMEYGLSPRVMVRGFKGIGDNEEDEEAIMAFLSGGSYKEDFQNVWNIMSWYALEEVARAYVDARETE